VISVINRRLLQSDAAATQNAAVPARLAKAGGSHHDDQIGSDAARTGVVVSESESIVAATTERIFTDFADPQTINRAEDSAWKELLWRALADAGLTMAWVPEQFGGAGASLADGFAILSVAGRFACGVPLAETLLAGWLLSRAGISAPADAMSIAPARPGDRVTLNADGTLSGRARGVPFARDVRYLAVLADAAAGRVVALVETAACRIADGRSLAGDALNVVTFDHATPIESTPAPSDLEATALMLMGATARSVETAGALEAMLALSVRYANERVAFGRPIGKFQAIQHSLARLAGEVAAAVAASGSAADAIAQAERFDDAILLEAASAKIRSAEAAAEGAAIAHQVHGAIGFTSEHILHRYSLRLLSWRDDFGNESYWAQQLGNMVAARGAAEFWPLVASR
jgi:acyl-CoA dehydrogenase